MRCPECQFDNPSEARRCARCHASLADAAALDITTTGGIASGWSMPAPAPTGALAAIPCLQPGALLAGRYEILQMLGEGGMGAVFKARDTELDRLVALKVIRPELSGNAEMLQRFKHELILARKVSHKNVIRIYDLGQGGGVKFITMEYVEGNDLKQLLRARRKLEPREAAGIVRQVCLALDAAHTEGVIHRDLKPGNIMVEENGRVLVMDFGIARSLETSGMTVTGALVGTPEYMSPEQAKGEKVDARSDLFTLGIIFYELLTGRSPYEAGTAIGALMKRLQERPADPSERDPAVPRALSDIVMKCLAIDPAERYQSAQDMLADLDAWAGPPPGTVIAAPPARLTAAARRWKWAAAGLGVAMVAMLGLLLYWRRSRPAGQEGQKAVTVLVADFQNATGEPVFDGALDPMFKIALEGAGFVTAYNRTNLPVRLEPGTTRLDEQGARRIALGQGLGVVVSGLLGRKADGYTLSVKAIQAVTGNAIANADVSAPNKDQVLLAVTKVAARIRRALGDATSESDQLFAMETLSAASLEAVHEYAQAMDFLSTGKPEPALESFSKAVDLDPNFGLAYAGLAVASRNLGRRQDALKYVQLAVAHIDRMTERERYRTRGTYYIQIDDHRKCVDEFGALVARFPSDSMAHNNLALCATYLRNMPKAVEEMRRALEILPNHAMFRNNLALYLSYGGDFPAGERDARTALELNPAYAKAYIALAFAQLGQGKVSEAAETYRKLEKIRASDATAGLGDLALYEGRFFEAARIFETGAAADLAAKNPDRAAAKFAALAYTQLLRGQNKAAVAAAESAASNSRTAKIRLLAGRVLAAAGEPARAAELAAGLGAELVPEPQAYAKLIEGEAALKAGDAGRAVQAFTEANALLDTWIGRFDLGRAYLEAGAFAQADSEFDRCIKRRGEAMALFLDEVPTYGYFPPVYYYLGRAREGLKSAGFAESYRTYLSIRGKAGEDPLLAEIRRRAGQ